MLRRSFDRAERRRLVGLFGSVAVLHLAGWGLLVAYGATRYSDVVVRNSAITSCNLGIFANSFTRVRISNVLVTNNATGLQTVGSASIQSFGNNQVYGNMTDGAPTSMISPM